MTIDINSLSENDRAELLKTLLSSVTVEQKVETLGVLSSDPSLALQNLDVHKKRKRAYNELLRIVGEFNSNSCTDFLHKLYLISSYTDAQITIEDLKNNGIEFLDPCFLVCSKSDKQKLLLTVAKDGLKLYKDFIKKARCTTSQTIPNTKETTFISSIIDSTELDDFDEADLE